MEERKGKHSLGSRKSLQRIQKLLHLSDLVFPATEIYKYHCFLLYKLSLILCNRLLAWVFHLRFFGENIRYQSEL